MARNLSRSRAVTLLSVLVATLAGPGAATAQSPQSVERRLEPGPDLQVRIAVVPELARRRGWYGEFQCATSRASRLLESAIGRKLRLRDRVPWSDFSGDEDLYALRSQLVRGVDHGGADIVVGLIPTGAADQRIGSQFVEDGLAAYSRGYVILRVGPELCDSGQLLAHEIAHIFGGIHRAGAGNLMNPTAPGSRVDELNGALFDLHRGRLIRDQEPPLGGEMLRMMWRLARADVSSAETWLRVGVLAATMGKHEPACEHYERALDIDPRQRVAWVNLGHARLQLGHFVPAQEAYLEALALDPDDGLVHSNLAVVYMSVKRPERAAASMNRALELGYEVPRALRDAIRQALGGAHGTTAKMRTCPPEPPAILMGATIR